MAARRALHPDRKARGYSQNPRHDATRNCPFPRQSAGHPPASRVPPRQRKKGEKPTLRRPCCFGRRGVRPLFFSAPLSRGAERRKTRGLARPPGRLAKPPGTLARRAPSTLRSVKGRLSALHLRRFPAPGRALPANRSIASGPPSASSWQAPVVGPGGAPAPPECEVTSLARGRRVPLRLRHVSGRRPSKSRTRTNIIVLGVLSRECRNIFLELAGRNRRTLIPITLCVIRRG